MFVCVCAHLHAIIKVLTMAGEWLHFRVGLGTNTAILVADIVLHKTGLLEAGNCDAAPDE